MMITMIVMSIIGGQLVLKVGVKTHRRYAYYGRWFWLLTTMDMHTTKLTATSYMMVIGLGMGLVMPTLTLALQESFPKKTLVS